MLPEHIAGLSIGKMQENLSARIKDDLLLSPLGRNWQHEVWGAVTWDFFWTYLFKAAAPSLQMLQCKSRSKGVT